MQILFKLRIIHSVVLLLCLFSNNRFIYRLVRVLEVFERAPRC